MAIHISYPNFTRPTDFWITVGSVSNIEKINFLVEKFDGSVCVISHGRFAEGDAAKIQGVRGCEIKPACSILERHAFMYLGYCIEKPFGTNQDDSYESQLMKKWRAQRQQHVFE